MQRTLLEFLDDYWEERKRAREELEKILKECERRDYSRIRFNSKGNCFPSLGRG